LPVFLECFLSNRSFCDDNPIPLQNQLEENLNLSNTQYTLFFALDSLPNILLSLFAGFFTDKYGRRITVTLFACFMVIGQFLFASGVSIHSFTYAAIGRLIFGIGSESYLGIFGIF